jgi:FtsP/CotA-like multicopper oxidase with cupredoxin domain
MKSNLTRREFIRAAALSLFGAAGAAALSRVVKPARAAGLRQSDQMDHSGHAMPMAVGEVDHAANGFNPTEVLTDFDYGKVSTLPDGQTLREYEIVAYNRDIEVVPGLVYPAWTYNGRIPGPTFRCTEGDRICIHFLNGSSHPHSMHFHGIHASEMDGVPGTPGMLNPGEDFTYEFDAEPFGLHLYHCHAAPLARHIAKGLYGAFIIDPPGGRPAVDHEFVMVMSGFDVDFDDENDFYAVNAIPFHYQLHPIRIGLGAKVRLYLVNILEFDLLNSFHLHANFFHYYPTGTSLAPSEFTDIILQTQAQRGILEFSYTYPGLYMFHAHNTEFAELGWTGFFDVVPPGGA